MNTGVTVQDWCDVRAKIPEWTVFLGQQSPTIPYCHQSTGFVTEKRNPLAIAGTRTIAKKDAHTTPRTNPLLGL